jgi:phage terminase Nu1 subunit (DNA packaging protein)
LLAQVAERVKRCERTKGAELTGVVVRLPSPPGALLTKRQLAFELGRSTRWVELRMREGLPVQSRRSPYEHARFDLEEVRRWLDARSRPVAVRLEERVARLERDVATLTAALNRERGTSGDPQTR